MIEIEKKGFGGPGIFLTRLERELTRRDLDFSSNHDTVLATDFVNTPKKFILRVDGINFLKMSSIGMSNFLKYRSNGKFRRLVKFNNILSHLLGEAYENVLSPFLTKLFFKRMNNSIIKAIKRSDFVVYQSIFSRDSWAYFCEYYGQDKCVIIPNGVDLNQFSPSKRNSNNLVLDNDIELKLVSSGSFRIHKRLQESIKLLKLVVKYIPKTKLYVLGDLDRQTTIVVEKLLAQDSSLINHIKFLGHINFDDLPDFYANMDIMLHPSWFDSCPNAVVESIASGTPVICSNIGGTSDLVGEGGIIVDEDFNFGFHEYYNYSKIPKINYKNYLNAVLKIHEERNSYSIKARKQAEVNLDIRKIADSYIEVFNAFKKN